MEPSSLRSTSTGWFFSCVPYPMFANVSQLRLRLRFAFSSSVKSHKLCKRTCTTLNNVSITFSFSLTSRAWYKTKWNGYSSDSKYGHTSFGSCIAYCILIIHLHGGMQCWTQIGICFNKVVAHVHNSMWWRQLNGSTFWFQDINEVGNWLFTRKYVYLV